jgi:oxygen-dependent protoporphyrinogen oxidase
MSFRRGLATLPRALASALGGRFLPGVAVERIETKGGEWRTSTSAGDFASRRVVLAGAAAAAARLVESIAPDAARALAEIPAPPVCVAHCAWPRDTVAHSVRGFGHLIAPRGGESLLGAVWSSSLFPDRAPAGKIMLTYFLGGRRNPDAASLDDATIASVVYEDARRALGARIPPEILRTTRYAAAIPQYEAGHRARLEAVAAAESANPGLRFLGNYRGGISVGDVVENAAIMIPP